MALYRAGLFALIVCLGACASGETVTQRGMDGGRADAPAPDGALPDAVLSCDPPCETGQSCVDGSCQTGVDLDGDGVLADVDCDDLDLAVGRTSERSCTSSCGTGVSRCTDGVWADCTAPTTCDCAPGSPPRMIPCMHCGLQRQVCDAGLWHDDGTCTDGGPCSLGEGQSGGACGNCGTLSRACMADCTWGPWDCTGEGSCVAGTMETSMQACGTCGTGTQSRTRTCSATSCEWDAWGAWGTCMGGGSGACTPGQMETGMQACGNCGTGTQTRTRSCDVAAGCAWGAWSAYGACSGGGACAPGATRACASGDRCGVERCSGSCTWGGCVPMVSGGCLCDNASAGSGCRAFQCCTTGGSGGWQFCSPTTCTYNSCAVHSC